MQNEFLPEETPEYRTPAPALPLAESAAETETAAEQTRLAAQRAARIKRLKKRYRRRSKAFMLSLIGYGIFTFLLFMAGNVLLSSVPVIGSFYAGAVTVLGMGAFFFWTKRKKPLIEKDELSALGGPEAVVPLLDMLGNAVFDRDIYALCDTLIPRLLEVKAPDTAEFTAFYRSILEQHLRRLGTAAAIQPAQADFCVAALRALEQIGSAKSLPLVEKLAAMNPRHPDSGRIRDAARECLPLLRIRAGLAANSRTLLRASAPEQAAKATLLRPASNQNPANPDELLRPSDGAGGVPPPPGPP